MQPYENESFLFDDFFVAQDETDPGEQINVALNGRQVPLHVKRGLSHSDKQAAKKVAVKTRVKPNGQIEITEIDEGEFAVELIFRCLKSWPFKYRDGKPVKITRENIRLMLGEHTEVLATLFTNNITKKTEAMQPFTTPSANS